MPTLSAESSYFRLNFRLTAPFRSSIFLSLAGVYGSYKEAFKPGSKGQSTRAGAASKAGMKFPIVARVRYFPSTPSWLFDAVIISIVLCKRGTCCIAVNFCSRSCLLSYYFDLAERSKDKAEASRLLSLHLLICDLSNVTPVAVLETLACQRVGTDGHEYVAHSHVLTAASSVLTRSHPRLYSKLAWSRNWKLLPLSKTSICDHHLLRIHRLKPHKIRLCYCKDQHENHFWHFLNVAVGESVLR